MLADAVSDSQRDWWVIGSAAVALHGIDPGEVDDVDLLMDEEDASRLLRRIGLTPAAGEASDRFRSCVFGRWTEPPLAVEIMAGFQVRDAHGWTRILPAERTCVEVLGCQLFVPTRAELVAMLDLFGRPKDFDRVRALNA